MRMIGRRGGVAVTAAVLLAGAWGHGFAQASAGTARTIVVDAKAAGTPFPHFW